MEPTSSPSIRSIEELKELLPQIVEPLPQEVLHRAVNKICSLLHEHRASCAGEPHRAIGILIGGTKHHTAVIQVACSRSTDLDQAIADLSPQAIVVGYDVQVGGEHRFAMATLLPNGLLGVLDQLILDGELQTSKETSRQHNTWPDESPLDIVALCWDPLARWDARWTPWVPPAEARRILTREDLAAAEEIVIAEDWYRCRYGLSDVRSKVFGLFGQDAEGEPVFVDQPLLNWTSVPQAIDRLRANGAQAIIVRSILNAGNEASAVLANVWSVYRHDGSKRSYHMIHDYQDRFELPTYIGPSEAFGFSTDPWPLAPEEVPSLAVRDN